MFETKLSNVIIVSLRNIKAIEKRAFPPLFFSGKAKTKEPLRGGYGL